MLFHVLDQIVFLLVSSFNIFDSLLKTFCNFLRRGDSADRGLRLLVSENILLLLGFVCGSETSDVDSSSFSDLDWRSNVGCWNVC